MSSRRELLQSAADEFARDYGTVPGGAWACRLTEDLRLEVTERGVVVASVAVRGEFDAENWPDEALEEVFIESTERDDAIESIADAGDQASWEQGAPWFFCPTHIDKPLMVCSSEWTCPEGHDVGHVGALGEK